MAHGLRIAAVLHLPVARHSIGLHMAVPSQHMEPQIARDLRLVHGHRMVAQNPHMAVLHAPRHPAPLPPAAPSTNQAALVVRASQVLAIPAPAVIRGDKKIVIVGLPLL